MGALKAGDLFFTVRFLRLLTTKFERTNAFKKGIIDKDGKKLKDPKTSDEKEVYNSFHKLVFNIKKIFEKTPLIGKSILTSYAAAVFLMKENYNLTNKQVSSILNEVYDLNLSSTYLIENNHLSQLKPGIYRLKNDIINPNTNEKTFSSGENVQIFSDSTEKIGDILGHPIFSAYHQESNTKLYVGYSDLEEQVTTSAVADAPKPLRKDKISRKRKK